MTDKKSIQYNLDTKNIWFPHQREPKREDSTFHDYWRLERDRIMNGFYIADGQVYISGWLYWHTVYWIIELDTILPNGKSYKTKGTPLFRDIEWEISLDLERAEREQKVYMLVGSRGFGKSNICASYVARNYNFFADSESLISGGFANDIKLLSDKVDLGLSNCHPVWHKQRLLNNWKMEVRAGWVDKVSGLKKGSNSRIIVRNYEEGNNTMASNGTRPKVQIIDEIGKIPNLINCVMDSVPSWMNDYGMFCTPILTGTGGDMEVGEEAGKMFNNPVPYNILECEDIWEGKGKIGKFMPVTKARNEHKKPQTLGAYLGMNHPDLDKITILVSDEQECMDKYVTPRREKAMKAESMNEIIKEKAYYPITPSECFLTVNSNDFPIEACKQHKDYLVKSGFKPQRIELYHDTQGVVRHKMTDKMPVTDFPIVSDTFKEGVIEMIEAPVSDAPGLYVAGVDPYKVSESEYSDSLGSVYIFKRMTNSMTETYQNMPVAWYTGRPKSIHTWYENVRMLLKFYNAIAMVENIDYGFIQFMIEKNETYYLAEGMSFLKEISPTTRHRSNYGLPPTTAMINHWLNSGVIYTQEMITKGTDQNGNEKKILGVTQINDVMLLEEMIKFNKEKGNFDRIRAFCIALSYANQITASIPKFEITGYTKHEKKLVMTPFTSLNRANIPGIKGVSSPFTMRKTNRN